MMKNGIIIIQIITYSIMGIITSYAQGNRNTATPTTPDPPDYSQPTSWSALPFRNDAADHLPFGEIAIHDSLKQADVFYVYPTLYMRGKTWNASLDNKRLNRRIDKYPVAYQASVFNRTARVYAPRYRQAIIHSFFDTTGRGNQALDLAYDDIKLAFDYYLKNFNQGRPIILASHSQGTHHVRRLMSDFFDKDTLLSKQLVCAYAIGLAMHEKQYTTLTPCTSPNQTGCYVTWSSFRKGHIPDSASMLIGDVCINPISWKRDTFPACSSGGVMINMRKRKGFASEAVIHNRYLWVKTRMPIVKHWKNLHLVDINLFWHNIRHNVAIRFDAFQISHQNQR